MVRHPDGVDAAEAAATAMCCFALAAVHKSAVRIGQSVIIFGAGMMGQVAAGLYRIAPTARVAIMDREPYRLSLGPETGSRRFARRWMMVGPGSPEWTGRVRKKSSAPASASAARRPTHGSV